MCSMNSIRKPFYVQCTFFSLFVCIKIQFLTKYSFSKNFQYITDYQLDVIFRYWINIRILSTNFKPFIFFDFQIEAIFTHSQRIEHLHIIGIFSHRQNMCCFFLFIIIFFILELGPEKSFIVVVLFNCSS